MLALGDNLELLGCSRAAEELFAGTGLLRSRGNRLVLPARDEQGLRAAMACLSRRCARVLRFPLIAAVRGIRPAMHALMETCSVDGLADCVTGGKPPGRMFLLWLHCPRSDRQVSKQFLCDVHALTPCEAAVVSRVYDGCSVPQTAARLNVSTNTVKSHLKSVFQKCGVRSQAQLIKLIALGSWIDARPRVARRGR